MASLSTVVWLGLVLTSPLLVPFLVPVYAAVARWRGQRHGDRHGAGRTLVGSTFQLLALGAFLATTTLSLPFGFEPWYVLLPVAGALAHRSEVAVRTRWGNVSGTASIEAVGVRALGVTASAVVEEVFYRGALVPLLGVVGPIGYTLASATSFGAAHGLLADRRKVAFKTVLGVVLAGVFLATDSLLAPILLHLGYNLTFVVRGAAATEGG